MVDSQARFEQLITKLRLMGFRMTPQRMALMHLLTISNEHPSAARLYEQIKVEFPTMSLATVYKTLDLLKTMGEVFDIDLPDDSHFDAYQPYPHPHFICTNCQKIVDGQLDEPVHILVNEMEHISGFQIHRHKLVFYGLCPDCQENTQ